MLAQSRTLLAWRAFVCEPRCASGNLAHATIRWGVRACIIFIACLAASHAEAGANDPLRAESRYLFKPMPDGEFTAADGRRHRLSEIWDDRPILVNLFYRRCTGICSPLLQSVKRAVDAAGGLGSDYAIVSLSFDSGDTTADMRAMADSLDLPMENAWYVGTAEKSTIDGIAAAIGFWYAALPETDQFDHPGLLAAVRDGKIVRILAANAVDKGRIRDLLLELRGIYVPFAPIPQGGSSLRCFRFNEETNELTLDWGLLLLVGPGCGAFATTAIVFLRRKRHSIGDRPH